MRLAQFFSSCFAGKKRYYGLLGLTHVRSGGLEKAIASAREFEMDTVQIFTKNNNQWAAKPLTESQIDGWKHAWGGKRTSEPDCARVLLINLAAPDDGLWKKSIDALIVELNRCEQLGLTGLVIHPEHLRRVTRRRESVG